MLPYVGEIVKSVFIMLLWGFNMVSNTLFAFWKDKEKQLGRRITIADIADATGLHRNTISDYFNNQIVRPDLEVIDKLCKYFDIPSGPVPFIQYERD
jgi:hypothetical protein